MSVNYYRLPDLGKPGILRILVSHISSTRELIPPSLRLIAHFELKLHVERFVCDRATPATIEKLRPKGIALHAYILLLLIVDRSSLPASVTEDTDALYGVVAGLISGGMSFG